MRDYYEILNVDKSCLLGDEPVPARLIWPIEKQPKIIAISNQGKIGLLKWEFAGAQPGKINKFKLFFLKVSTSHS